MLWCLVKLTKRNLEPLGPGAIYDKAGMCNPLGPNIHKPGTLTGHPCHTYEFAAIGVYAYGVQGCARVLGWLQLPGLRNRTPARVWGYRYQH